MTIPHLYDFGPERARVGDELTSESWDAIRASAGPFALAETRVEWNERSRPELTARARDIVELARQVGARRLCSYGVGAADLEYAIVRAGPELELVCTEYAPQTVERLQSLFPEATVVRHDLLEQGPLPAELHLMHRIETEFSNASLRAVLARFDERVVLVPGHLLGPRVLGRELYLRVFRRSRTTRAGWTRTKSALRALWSPTHVSTELRVGSAVGFLLERRSSA